MIIYDYLFWLFVYAFLGWLYESILCSITGKKLVNRGFLNGPICPVYGCGAIIVILCLSPLKSCITIFTIGMMLTCIVEYITSWLLETIFHVRWWDYSHFKCNINGRVCLLGALVFGGFSTLLLKVVHPYILQLTLKIPASVLIGVVLILISMGIGDCIITVVHILRLNGKLKEIQVAMNSFVQESYSRAKGLKETLYENFEGSNFYSERIKGLLENTNAQEKRLLNAFPRLRSIHYNEALEHFKYTRAKALSRLREIKDIRRK